MAIECAEAFTASSLFFIPCAVPPHKETSILLPFDLRCGLLLAAIESVRSPHLRSRMSVCEVEKERDGPSYTIDTLRILGKRYPDQRLIFILGSEDYARLPTWKDWSKLPEAADLLVLPRTPDAENEFDETSRRLWPAAHAFGRRERNFLAPGSALSVAFELPCGARLLFLRQSLLEISSSLIRERRHQGKSLDFLIPGAVTALLEAHESETRSAWSS